MNIPFGEVAAVSGCESACSIKARLPASRLACGDNGEAGAYDAPDPNPSMD